MGNSFSLSLMAVIRGSRTTGRTAGAGKRLDRVAVWPIVVGVGDWATASGVVWDSEVACCPCGVFGLLVPLVVEQPDSKRQIKPTAVRQPKGMVAAEQTKEIHNFNSVNLKETLQRLYKRCVLVM